MQHKNIVHVVDPDEAIGEALSALLDTYEIDVRTFPDAESFVPARSSWDTAHGCVLIEINLPGLSGLWLLRWLRAQGFSLPVVILTNTRNDDIERHALEFGATDVIEKPFINAFLVERLSELLPGAEQLHAGAASLS